MTLEYTLETDALLTYQLYVASKSDQIKRQRRRSRWVVSLMGLAVSAFYIFLEMYLQAGLFGGLGLVWFFLHPFYSAWYYKRHYKKHVETALSGFTNRDVTVSLNGALLLRDETAESRVKLAQVQSVVEIPDYTLIMLSSGQSVILPEKQLSNLGRFIGELVEATGAEHRKELEWRWK